MAVQTRLDVNIGTILLAGIGIFAIYEIIKAANAVKNLDLNPLDWFHNPNADGPSDTYSTPWNNPLNLSPDLLIPLNQVSPSALMFDSNPDSTYLGG